LLFTRNLSPLQSSKFSFEYLLLPPRSALEVVSLRFTPSSFLTKKENLHALLLFEVSHLLQRLSMGNTL